MPFCERFRVSARRIAGSVLLALILGVSSSAAVQYWSMVEEVVVDCAFCGEPFALGVDTTGGEEQSYFEDCPVCCRPMEIFVRSRPGEVLSISVTAD
jgi:cysteine-rich CPXCG protein